MALYCLSRPINTNPKKQMMTYNEAKNTKNLLEIICDGFSRELKKFPKGAMGLTTDEAKQSPEWKAARYGYDQSFAKLREFNRTFSKTFKKEILAEQKAKRQVA